MMKGNAKNVLMLVKLAKMIQNVPNIKKELYKFLVKYFHAEKGVKNVIQLIQKFAFPVEKDFI